MAVRLAWLQQIGNGKLEPEIRSLRDGCKRLGIAVELFHAKALSRGRVPIERDTLVAGHIPVVLAAFRQLGIEPPQPQDYPACLRPFLQRRVWLSTVGEVVRVLHEEQSPPFFAKPLYRHKRFHGAVIASWDDLRALGGVSNQTQVACSEIVSWKAEYRTYVTGGRVVGVRHYAGDPAVAIDERVVEAAVETFTQSGRAPAGYGIDFGVLSTGETALVEVNDGYALGSYGLDDGLYTDLILARWCELTEVS
jgi:hypothetical protein